MQDQTFADLGNVIVLRLGIAFAILVLVSRSESSPNTSAWSFSAWDA